MNLLPEQKDILSRIHNSLKFPGLTVIPYLSRIGSTSAVMTDSSLKLITDLAPHVCKTLPVTPFRRGVVYSGNNLVFDNILEPIVLSDNSSAVILVSDNNNSISTLKFISILDSSIVQAIHQSPSTREGTLKWLRQQILKELHK